RQRRPADGGRRRRRRRERLRGGPHLRDGRHPVDRDGHGFADPARPPRRRGRGARHDRGAHHRPRDPRLLLRRVRSRIQLHMRTPRPGALTEQRGSEMGRLDGKVAIVSGAAGGMGRETAELFAREGATVVAGDIQDALPGPSHDAVHFVRLDVTDEDSWATVVADTVAEHGKLDILVHNAGVLAYEPILETTLETWNRLAAADQTGVLLGMRAATPPLIANG